MYCIDVDDIPSAEITVSETPAQGREYDDNLIKFSNITSKTPYNTVRNFTVIDVETTGLSAQRSEILEVCAIKFRDGLPQEKFSTLTAPRKKIPPKITKINGITWEMVKDFPHFSLIANSLVEFIGGDNIVGHNLEFDLGFLLEHGADVTQKKRKYFDTLIIAQRILKRPKKKWDPDLESYEFDYDNYDVDNYKLATLCDYYRIPLCDAHRASGDSYATGLLFLELADERTSHPRYFSEEQRRRKMNESKVAIESFEKGEALTAVASSRSLNIEDSKKNLIEEASTFEKPDLLDRLIPSGSLREKILPFIIFLLVFVIVISVLIHAFT